MSYKSTLQSISTGPGPEGHRRMLSLHQSMSYSHTESRAPARRVPRVLSLTVSQPYPGPTTGEEWHASLGEAFEREGGAFITLHSAPENRILEVDGKPRQHSMCMPFLPYSWASLARVVKLVREQRIDIIMWHFMPPLTNPYVWALSLLCPGVHHWTMEHASQTMPLPKPPSARMLLLKRMLLGRYQRMVCVSSFVADYLQQRGYRNVLTNYMFVNTDRLRPDASVRAAVRGQLGIASDAFLGVLAGYLIPEKGVHIAIDAMARLPADTRLLVIGEGPARPALEAQAAAAGIADRVQFLGRQNNVGPFIQASDVLLCPSLWAEAAGLVNMEGQACGVPVVASRVGGIPEIVADGRTGVLFEPGDTAALTAALERLRADPELRARLGAAGRARAVEHFSMQSRIPIYIGQFREAR